MQVQGPAVATSGGLRLSFQTDKPVYAAGEPVMLTATFENPTHNPVVYTMFSAGDPPVIISFAQTSYAHGFELFEPGLSGRTVVPVVVTGTLAAGQSITRTVVWDQRLRGGGGSFLAPPGQYQVSACVALGDYNGDRQPTNLTASLGLTVTGTPAIVTPAQAVQLALQTPRVGAWFTKFGSLLICMLPNGQRLEVTLDGSQERAQSDPLVPSKQGGAMCIVNLEDSARWKLQLLAKPSFPPSTFNPADNFFVLVSLTTGEVSFREWPG